MAVSKRLRFEILRRDNHTCRYCGASAPDATITLDHVTPIALGGTDDPANLVSACTDCNSGKSSITPDSPLVADVEQDALRWAAALRQAAALAGAEIATRQTNYDAFELRWGHWENQLSPGKWYPLPPDWPTSIDQILNAGLSLDLLIESVDIAMRSTAYYDAKWKYFCGVCWKKIAKIHEIARDILTAEEAD